MITVLLFYNLPRNVLNLWGWNCRLVLSGFYHFRLASSEARAKERPARGPTLSSSEALGALSPFYLAVHPDLFARFPQEKVKYHMAGLF